jgi:hypothetical protein
MKIGIIDADLIGKKNQRFPNLCCMKISSFYKQAGNQVELLQSYSNLQLYDKVFIAKVFTDTLVPNNIIDLSNVIYGGTGFYYDKAKPLPRKIEHCMPDYTLYSDYVSTAIFNGASKSSLKFFTDFSIGYLTRGCFRKCPFCVNKKYDQAFIASPLSEFVDDSRKYICLLDDNFLSHLQWEQMLNNLNNSGHRFHFRQGLDERLITDKMAKQLSISNLVLDLIFAFDNINDSNLIIDKIKLLRKYMPNKTMKFYVFCGFDRNNQYDDNFYTQDIIDTFERIKILMEYKCLPYIMRHANYVNSPHRGTYINLARWCNQPSLFKKKSYKQFCELNGINSACYKYYSKLPDECSKYIDMRWSI